MILGFCDSKMSADEVVEIIQNKVKHNVYQIDKVIFICAGRIEQKHIESMTKFMTWLKYKEKDYKNSFLFIYNKADLQTKSEQMEGLAYMCDKLGVDTDRYNALLNVAPGRRMPMTGGSTC